MQKIKQIGMVPVAIMAFVAIIGAGGLLYAPSALAADTLQCAFLPQSICGNTGETGIISFLEWVLNIMIAVVGVAAVGGTVWAGILYLSAGDNSSQVQQAKTIITGVAIGLLIFGIMYLAINWLVPGGVL